MTDQPITRTNNITGTTGAVTARRRAARRNVAGLFACGLVINVLAAANLISSALLTAAGVAAGFAALASMLLLVNVDHDEDTRRCVAAETVAAALVTLMVIAAAGQPGPLLGAVAAMLVLGTNGRRRT